MTPTPGDAGRLAAHAPRLAVGHEAIRLFRRHLAAGLPPGDAERAAVAELAERLRRDQPAEATALTVELVVVALDTGDPKLLLLPSGSCGGPVTPQRAPILPVRSVRYGEQPEQVALDLLGDVLPGQPGVARPVHLEPTGVYEHDDPAGLLSFGYLVVVPDLPVCREVDDWRRLLVVMPTQACFTGGQHRVLLDARTLFDRWVGDTRPARYDGYSDPLVSTRAPAYREVHDPRTL
ncbi:hypothetical protein [Saccharothrix sp. HUAS TT1]|uniref:hypothetical protein n=1 Tax=unclassified Saccharothrix TaxID=2593673 RepID=UPI00345BD47E